MDTSANTFSDIHRWWWPFRSRTERMADLFVGSLRDIAKNVKRRHVEARFDYEVSMIETGRWNPDGSPRCLDCEVGEPHVCEVADREYRAALKIRDAAQAIIDDMEQRMEMVA